MMKRALGYEYVWWNAIFVIRNHKSTKHLDTLIEIFSTYLSGRILLGVMFGGMYVLLTIMGFRSLSSCFGSILYGLTSYFAIIIIAGTHPNSIPCFYSMDICGLLALFSGKRLLRILLTVALALEVRAGHPQITYYFFYLLRNTLDF